jgi:hypothetical protein
VNLIKVAEDRSQVEVFLEHGNEPPDSIPDRELLI